MPNMQVVELSAEEEQKAMEMTITLQMQQFFDEFHYRIINANLTDTWDRKKATVMALTLFEQQGTAFEEGEKERLASVEESELLYTLLARMPDELKHNFESFGSQLTACMSSIAEIRRAVDGGSAQAIQEAMEHIDSTGLTVNVMKKATVQAGAEVSAIRKRHDSWVRTTDSKVSRLVRSSEDAAHAQQQLRALQSQLDSFGGAQNEKSKKVLMGITANNEKGLMNSVFSAWMGYNIKMKAEKGIRDMFEAEILALDTKLMEYRQAALNNVRNVLMRKASENDGNLLLQVWKAWANEVQETIREAGSQGAMKALEEKLASHSAAQAENTKKVMARMSAGSDNALLTVVIGSWVQWLADYKKNKEMEDAVKAQEQQIAEYMAKKKEEAKGVLDRMNASTDSGLLEHCMSSWCQKFVENRKAKEMEDLMAGAEGKFAALNGRQKDNAKGVMSRVNEELDLNCLLKHFAAWALDVKLERVMRHYSAKMENKKQQLGGVQSLFRNFASQLDQGLRDGEGGGANESSGRRKREDGSVVLPDIHNRTR